MQKYTDVAKLKKRQNNESKELARCEQLHLAIKAIALSH